MAFNPNAGEHSRAHPGWAVMVTQIRAHNRPPLLLFIVLFLVFTLVGAACSSDSSDSSDTGSTPEEGEASSDQDDSSSDPQGEDDTSTIAGPLFSPTASDEPFALDGGAVSSDEGVNIVSDDPRSALRPETVQVSELWETDWTRQTIDVQELLPGLMGFDPRDGIPPIDVPQFEPISAATWLGENEPGALVQMEGEVRFYPLSILTQHEIVNDRIGDIPVAVTFCPLCNTALTFDRRVDGEVLRFGVSGLLRNSDLVMWDDKSTSLWQQLTGEGIVGQFAGTQLDIVATAIVSYGDVVESFPDARSLARETGFGRNYGQNPYVGYSSSPSPFLFDGDPDPRFPALSRVVGVSGSETDRAYPFEVIQTQGAVNDEIDGQPIVVMWGGSTADALDAPSIRQSEQIGTGIVFDRQVGDQVLTFSPSADNQFTDAETGSTWNLLGRAIDGPLSGESLTPVAHRNEFWFAWAAFFPDGDVHGR